MENLNALGSVLQSEGDAFCHPGGKTSQTRASPACGKLLSACKQDLLAEPLDCARVRLTLGRPQAGMAEGGKIEGKNLNNN